MAGQVAQFLIDNSNKLGIDLDSVSRLRLLISYFNARYMFPDKKIRVFRSSGGNGYHIEVFGVKSTLRVRRTLGDCQDRMMYSEFRSKNKDNQEEFVIGDPVVDDVLFTVKTMKYVNRRGENVVKRQMRKQIDERSIIAQDFW